MEKNLLLSILLIILTLTRLGTTQFSGSMEGIQSGTIILSANDLSSVSSKAYTLTLASSLGVDPLGCALALAGYQTMNQGMNNTYAVLVTSTTFTNNNTIMTMIVSFRDVQRGITNTTVWLKLKWTYLIISSTFDGKFTNIWTTFSEFDPQNVNNAPVHSQGLTFMAMGGITADCDIYMDPLMQVDLQNCKPLPVNGQYEGGKIIIHAYITGFSLLYQQGSPNKISVSKGSSQDPKSDSKGWQIVYSTTYPNGPKISVVSSNVKWLQVSFLYVRMDYYAEGYPLKSQLKYSSSHIYTSAESYNSKVQLKNKGIGQLNENYFDLPEYTYSIYGFSGLKFDSDSSRIFYLQMNLDSLSNLYQIHSSNTNQESIISADLFVKNIMELCDWRQKNIQLRGKSSQIKINPHSNIVSAVDVTNNLPLNRITHSQHPLVFKYAVASSTQQVQITFVSTLLFAWSKPNDNLRIEVRWFQNLNSGSLIDKQLYRLKVKANGVLIVDEIYQHQNQIASYISPVVYRSIASQSDTVFIQSTITFSSNTSSQEFYLLVAVRSESTVYNPYTKKCSLLCPFGYGIDASLFPLTCVQCDIQSGRIYSVKNNSCICPQGAYLLGNKCQPCGSNCAVCNPADPDTCYSCIGSAKFIGGVCDESNCSAGTVSVLYNNNISQCLPCQYPCATCLKNPQFCLTCIANLYLYPESPKNQTCLHVCPVGTVLQGYICRECSKNCKICLSKPQNCIRCQQPYALYQGTCTLTCQGIIWPTSQGKICLSRCPDSLFTNDSSKSCLPCAANCLTCDRLASNCTSCRAGVLVDFGVCISQCEPNQYISGGVCLNCSYPCTKCFRNKDYCVGCIQGMIVNEGKCVKQCQIGEFYYAKAMTCLQCGLGCATCLNQTLCLTCLNISYTPHQGLCPFCEDTCEICGPDNRCLSCQPGFYLFNGACLRSCPIATLALAGNCVCRNGVLQDGNCTSSCLSGFYSLQGVCFACASSCLQCSSILQCTRCFSGYKLEQQKCIQSNVCHYGQYFKSGKCVRLCDQGWYFFESSCFFARCPDGYVPNIYGGCARQAFYQCPNDSYQKEGKCVSSCGNGFWQTETRKCKPCPSNCDRCLSGDQCLTCSSGYSNIYGRCYYSGCANGTVAVSGNCTLSCPVGTQQKNKVCVKRCPEQSYFFDPFCYFTCPSGKHSQYNCLNRQ